MNPYTKLEANQQDVSFGEFFSLTKRKKKQSDFFFLQIKIRKFSNLRNVVNSDKNQKNLIPGLWRDRW